MYAVNRSPKFYTGTRRGGTKKIDNFEGRDLAKRVGQGTTTMSSPVPVFNGKRSTSGRSLNNTPQEEPVSPQHKECVHFLSHTWSKVQQELEHNWSRKPKIYQDKTSNPIMDNFKPFDLEEWWGTRTFQKMTKSS